MLKWLYARSVKNVSGATAIEYALLAGCVALAIITAVGSLGHSVQGLYGNVANGLH